jgi:hypothetical protein
MQDVSVPAANRLNCSCNPACDESIYDVSISMAQWPSSQYMNVMVLNQLNSSIPYKYNPVNSCGGGLHAFSMSSQIGYLYTCYAFRYRKIAIERWQHVTVAIKRF